MENKTPLIIADTYRIIGEIGAGGGGIVYLAEHLRLNKKVVLKADKRNLFTKPEVLRREVDALKNLSHTYIPQVYDFIVEEGKIYTIMDYIDGESFDKPLKRGELFSQVQVIEWACQLLGALDYLHSRPPHGILHSDIKPANIMLTPEGDIRLIDFNIALALGEEGVIAVGRSFGYASPEHYGLHYSTSNTRSGINNYVVTDLSKGTASYVETALLTKTDINSNDSRGRGIMLDRRSDIYSLGATLYHIMTGLRPNQNASEVKAISNKEYSSAVIKIIEKAMNPDPDLRYQSSKEMLLDFEQLRENDFRTKRYKRKVITTISVFTLLFIVGGFAVFVGLKQMEQLQNAYVLAEYSRNALGDGDVVLAIDYALKALPEERDIFTPPNTAEAQKALTNALNVYDLSEGFKAHKTVKLPSSLLNIEISPSGETAAAIYAYSIAVFDINTGEIIITLPVEPSALSEVKYLSEAVIIYAGDGAVKAHDIVEDKELWVGRPTTSIAISGDGKIVAAVYKDEKFATVYDTESGDIIQEINFEGKYQSVTVNDSFANPNDNLFELNHDGTMLGTSFEDGSLWVYDLMDNEASIEIFDSASGYTHFEGGFFQQYFGFSGTEKESSVFAIIDTEKIEQTGGFESSSPFGVEADGSGIYVQAENMLVNIHPVTGEQTGLVNIDENILYFARGGTHTAITTENGYIFFDENANMVTYQEDDSSKDFMQMAGGQVIIGSIDSPNIKIMKLESHPQAQIFTYDPSYDHDEARISVDDKTVMLFSYDQMRLYDIGGNIITELSIPNAEELHDQQYIRDESGSRLELIYNNGKILAYSAEDGRLIYETYDEKPDLTLYEEFYTDRLLIRSPLHGVPKAYDKKTGKFICELEKDAYLTYVTQVEEYIITEYMTASGERYGLLLNEQCKVLAKLPNLCDIIGNELIFDDYTGNLRKSRIYHINELIELARKQKKIKEE